jgi:hypothetical protein
MVPCKYKQWITVSDKYRIKFHPSGGTIHTFAVEEINVDGMSLDYSTSVLVRVTFVTEDQIHVSQYHVHSKWFLDSSSYLGLLVVLILFIYALVR